MSQRVRVKICGVTSVEDALLAANLGADAIGLNFHKGSPRCVEAATAAAIVQALPPFVDAVAVYTDARTMREQIAVGEYKYLQWHGELADLPELWPGALKTLRLIVALRVRDRETLIAGDRWFRALPSGEAPAAFLLDSYHLKAFGGTGTVAPWDVIAEFSIPVLDDKGGLMPRVPIILAGGLTPENVAEAIRIVRPYAVDVASGVESSPGKKDPEKMQRFIENARAALA